MTFLTAETLLRCQALSNGTTLTYNGQKAIPGSLYDQCLRTCRIILGVPALAPTAKAAYELLDSADIFAHITPPPGVPCFFRTPNAAWHVTISDVTPWFVWSTDIKRKGQFDRVPKSLIQRAWNAEWLGFARELNGITLP